MNPVSNIHSWTKPDLSLYKIANKPAEKVENSKESGKTLLFKANVEKAQQMVDAIKERIPPISSFQNAGFIAILQRIADANIIINSNKEIFDLFPELDAEKIGFYVNSFKKVFNDVMGGFKLFLSPINILFNLKRIIKQGIHISKSKNPLSKIKNGFNIISSLGQICESIGSLGSGLQYFNLIQSGSWIAPLTGVGIGLSAAGIVVNSIGAFQSWKSLKKVNEEKDVYEKLKIIRELPKGIFGISKKLKVKIEKEIDKYSALHEAVKKCPSPNSHIEKRVATLENKLEGRIKDHIKESKIFIIAAVISIIGTVLLIFAPPVAALFGAGILIVGISLTIFNTVLIVKHNNELEDYLNPFIGDHRRKKPIIRIVVPKMPRRIATKDSGRFLKFLDWLITPPVGDKGPK